MRSPQTRVRDFLLVPVLSGGGSGRSLSPKIGGGDPQCRVPVGVLRERRTDQAASTATATGVAGSTGLAGFRAASRHRRKASLNVTATSSGLTASRRLSTSAIQHPNMIRAAAGGDAGD